MNASVRAGAGVIGGLVLTALWLWWAPGWVGGFIGAMPAAVGEAVFTAGVFGPMIVLATIGARLGKVAAFRAGDAPVRAAVTGAVLGLGGVTWAAGLAAIAGAVSWQGAGGAGVATALGIATVAIQVFAEELLFRGWLQPLATRAIGTPAALLLVAAAFAALHLLGGAHGALTLANLAGGGLLFGLLAARDGGIVGAVAAHGAWNAGEQLLLGLDPNPGASSFGAVVNLDLGGPASWGGSDAGLNASWAMAFALMALLVPLALRWRARDAL